MCVAAGMKRARSPHDSHMDDTGPEQSQTAAESLCHQPCYNLGPSDFGSTSVDLQVLASKLEVDHKVALSETLAYAALCKLRRSEEVPTSSLVEVWDSIPEAVKTRDRSNPKSRIVMLGPTHAILKPSRQRHSNFPTPQSCSPFMSSAKPLN